MMLRHAKKTFSNGRRYLQYVLIAHDDTHNVDDALKRRMAVREQHINRAHDAKSSGLLLVGGALMDNQDRMNGSLMVFEAENEGRVREWVAEDPYVKHGVWKTWSITPFKLVK
jgi:hypothetical protein